MAKKLGLKDGRRVLARNVPGNCLELVTPRPEGVMISSRLRNRVDACHFFTRSAADSRVRLPKLMDRIKQDGMIWVSWPKRASGAQTDGTEETIRDTALPLGLVDLKVCAVDETRSRLKLVIRKELRN